MKKLDLKNKKFGKLLVLKEANTHITPSGYSISMWYCKCDCGNEIIVSTNSLKSGKTKSCGHCNDIQIGDKFGKLTVISKTDKYYINPSSYIKNSKHNYRSIWKCKCDCGNIIEIQANNLKSGNTKSCGHCNDIQIGDRFGRLVVLNKTNDFINKDGTHRTQWLCKCDCGNETIVLDHSLKSGNTKSCGCLQRELAVKSNTIHGLSHTPIYSKYKAMIDRCYNPNNSEYKNYGQRGIRVCSEWLGNNGFINFYNWSIKNEYSPNLSIDRINVDGNYEPSNCRWIPKEYQAVNKRNNKNIFFNEEYYTISQIANILGIDSNFLYWKLSNNNFNLSSLFTYITNEYGITRAYLLDRYGNPIPINAIYFINEYGFPVNMNEYNIDEDN